jgi:hypothetical protein
VAVTICFSVSLADADDGSAAPSAKKSSDTAKWTELNGKWASIEFGGEGSVEIDDQIIKLGMGSPLTGIRWKGKVPRENYELTLEARRTEGLDFFCGLTFPVGKDHVSFVLGGWGGGVVGISSIDGYDASENDTTMYQEFKMKQWYKVRVRVTDGAIQCWIDDDVAVDQPRAGHTFDIRFEMDESLPLGIAAFQCKSELRKIRLRNLSADEIKTAASELDDSPSPRGGGQ